MSKNFSPWWIYKIKEVNLAYNFLEERLREALDKISPIMKIQPGGRTNNWISDRTKELMNIRENKKVTAISTDNQEDWKNFKKVRNAVTESVRREKKNNIKELFEKADKDRDASSLFRITREKLGWVTGGPPSALTLDGKLISKPREIAEALSIYFDKKITTEVHHSC